MSTDHLAQARAELAAERSELERQLKVLEHQRRAITHQLSRSDGGFSLLKKLEAVEAEKEAENAAGTGENPCFYPT